MREGIIIDLGTGMATIPLSPQIIFLESVCKGMTLIEDFRPNEYVIKTTDSSLVTLRRDGSQIVWEHNPNPEDPYRIVKVTRERYKGDGTFESEKEVKYLYSERPDDSIMKKHSFLKHKILSIVGKSQKTIKSPYWIISDFLSTNAPATSGGF